MAKRFTDTAKWAKGSFCDLSLKMKLVWIYLCDNCDHAGIWDINLRLLSFQIGEEVTSQEIETAFGDKVQLFDNKILIKPFIEFQYGNLNPDNRAHFSVISRLKKVGAIKVLTRALQGPKDKDKDKDKDKESISIEKFDFEKPYSDYPRKEGKAAGMRRLHERIKTEEDYLNFCQSVKHYAAIVEDRDSEHIKMWSSFIGTDQIEPWRDYINPPKTIKRKAKAGGMSVEEMAALMGDDND